MDDNKSAQQDELFALSNIYDANVFTMSDDPDEPGGMLTTIMDLPQPFVVHMTECQAGQQEFRVQFLPPIVLYFQLPECYPSSKPPRFSLSCKWLTYHQLEKMCKKFDDMWEENKGEVVLFLWASFLQDELVEFLDIKSPLDLSDVVPHKRKDSIDVDEKPEPESSSVCEPNDPRAIQDILSQNMLLPAILDFDTKQINLRFLTTLFECQVCFSEKLGKFCLKFVGCGHVFCKECMKGHFEVQIRDGNVIGLTCPYHQCNSQATPGQVQEIVNTELFLRYDRLLLQASLDMMSDIMYCPRKSCGNAVITDPDSSMGCCAACRYVFCIFCKLTYHGVSPCRIRGEDMKVLREAYVTANTEEKRQLERRYGKHILRQLIEDSFTNQWLDEHSKKCPNCGTHIQKIDGCNKITCTKCHTYFCWLCGKPLSRNNPYGHFNTPGDSCFHRLFHGVEIDEDYEGF